MRGGKPLPLYLPIQHKAWSSGKYSPSQASLAFSVREAQMHPFYYCSRAPLLPDVIQLLDQGFYSIDPFLTCFNLGRRTL